MSAEQMVEHFGPQWEQGPFERGTDGPRVIVVGIDSSPTSMNAGSYAAGLARRQHSRLVVVYITASSTLPGLASLAGVAAEQETFDEIIGELRTNLSTRAHELEVPITLLVRGGDPFTELRAVATELSADMVVIGASEQAGHRLVGSVASKLVRAAQWPVVVVP